MDERQPETEVFIATQFPLSGIHSRPGPSPQHIRVGAEQARLSERRGLAGRLGRIIENSYIGVWSGQIIPDFDKDKIRNAIDDVISRLSPIRQKTFNYIGEVEPLYQALTEPPEALFLGNERVIPSLDSLAYIFQEVDRVYDAGIVSKFQEIGDSYGKINSKIRYLVEAGLILAKTAVDVSPPFVNGPRLIANQRVRDAEGKEITQFDGVCLPSLDGTWTSSWGAIEIKARFRTRETTGQRKLERIMAGHLAAFQDQLGRIIIAKQGDAFTLPSFVIFAYLRGTQPNVYHFQRLDLRFVQKWLGVLGEKLDNSFFDEEQNGGAQVVVNFLKLEEERLLTRKGNPKKNEQ